MHFRVMWLSLVLALSAACGSSQKKAAPPAPEGQEEKAAKGPSEFCERYSGMYCRYEDDEEGGTKYEEFSSMSDEDKSQVLFECEMALESADDETRAKMEECLGCLADCSSASSCLMGAASCPEPDAGGDEG